MPFVDRLRAVVAILLLVGAGLFIVGVAVERAVIANESNSAVHQSETESSDHAEGSGTEASQPATPAAESTSETVFGINVESWPLAVAAAIASIGGAFAAWRTRQRAILFVVAVLAVAFAGLDVREVIHQSSEGRTGIVVLSSIIGLVHLSAGVIAAFVASRT